LIHFLVSSINLMEAQEVSEKHPARSPVATPSSDTSDSEHAPPPDGGLKAWLFLAAASFTMVITWGTSFESPEAFREERGVLILL
jgi:hypothetical protein